MDEILREIKVLREIVNSPFALIAGWASILSFLVTFVNSLLIFQIFRRIKNKRAMIIIKNLLEHNIEILEQKEIPSDMRKRVLSNLEDIKRYKWLIFSYKLRKLIKEVIAFEQFTPQSHILLSKLTLIKNEIDEIQ